MKNFFNLREKLTPSKDLSDWISDFIKSDAPQFDGKSAEERKKMATAAYYAAQKNESLKGDQHKLDVDKDGKIEKDDLKKLRGEGWDKTTQSADKKPEKYIDKDGKTKIRMVPTKKEVMEEVELQEEQKYYSLVHKSTNKVLSTHKDLESAKDEHRGIEQGVRAHYRIAVSTKNPTKNFSMKEEISEDIDESSQGKVQTKKYSWGTMKTVHHGADFSIPLHPEHHRAIHALQHGQEHKFKDETGRHWAAKRDNDTVHFHTTGNGSMKTSVKHSDLKENAPFDGPYKKTTGNVKDKSGAVHTPLSRVRHLARQGAQQAASSQNKKNVKEYLDLEDADDSNELTEEQLMALIEEYENDYDGEDSETMNKLEYIKYAIEEIQIELEDLEDEDLEDELKEMITNAFLQVEKIYTYLELDEEEEEE